MQDIVFYAAVNETQGIVRDSANARNQAAPILVLGVSACLKMRLFAACNAATPYPIASLSGISDWNWRMDADFERNTPSKLVADAEDIFVHTVTDSVDGETVSFTEFVIPISDMNTQELATWLGNEKKRSGLIGELVGYDSEGNAVFVLQIEDFTIRNRIAGLGDPTVIDQEVATRSQTVQMIQAVVSSSAATKQDRLTSANAGANISIDENGVISNTYSLPSATTGSKGGVILATAAETISGSDATKSITPAAFMSALSGNDPIIAKSAIKAFQPITNLGSASSATLKSGGAYRLSAISGNHYLTVSDVPADKYGMDTHVELFVGNASLVHVSDPLILMDVLFPNAVNDCVIKFRDGTARLYVEDHDYGYVVTSAGGTEGTVFGGSLYFGLTGATASYIAFANSLDRQTVILPETATVNRAVNVVGNGYTETIIGGSVSCASKTTFCNLTMSGVSVLGGTATLGDVYIPSGTTVSVSGGVLAVEKVSGNGGTIDLGGTCTSVGSGSSMLASGCSFTSGGGGGTFGGGVADINGGNATFFNCGFYNNTGTSAAIAALRKNAEVTFSGCTFDSSNSSGTAILVVTSNAHVTVANCTFDPGQDIYFSTLSGSELTLLGSNHFKQRVRTYGGAGAVAAISSGAIVDLTGNTNSVPINPGGGVTFESGGATVYPSAGSASAYTLGGMTIPQIGNTNVVNLNNSSMIISSGVTAYVSGCTISGGSSNAGYYGIFNAVVGQYAVFENCTLTGNVGEYGAAVRVAGGSATLIDTVVSGNTGSNPVYANASWIEMSGCTVTDKIGVQGGGTIKLMGSNSIANIDKAVPTGSGFVIISSGASIDLTSGITPGGAITLYGGHYETPTTIIGSGGVSRTFDDLEIKGSTINSAGLIFGATVYSNEGDDHEIRYTEDGGATSSSVFISGQTAFSVPGALMKVVNT